MAARRSVCKGRDAKGRIKKGYSLAKGGLRKTSTRRRRKPAAAAPSLASLLSPAKPARRRRRAAPKRTPAQLALSRRGRKVAARYSPAAQALTKRARTVAARVRAGQAARVVVSIEPAAMTKPPAPSRQRRLPGTARRRKPRQASFKF